MEIPLSFTAGQYVGDDSVGVRARRRARQYVNCDTAATSSASVAVARAVQDFLPWYASVHRGAGIRSQLTSARYEEARDTMVRFVGGDPSTHMALFPRNTTEAINMLGLPAEPHQGRRGRHHRGGAPRQPAAVAATPACAWSPWTSAGRSTSPPSRPPSTSTRGRRSWPSPVAPTSPAGCPTCAPSAPLLVTAAS